MDDGSTSRWILGIRTNCSMASPLMNFHKHHKGAMFVDGNDEEGRHSTDTTVSGSRSNKKAGNHVRSPRPVVTKDTTTRPLHRDNQHDNKDDHSENDESSSSSSSSADQEEDVLSDTEYSADDIRRKYTQPFSTTGTTFHENIIRYNDQPIKWPKTFRNIEQKLYHQFHYRDQIFQHLVSRCRQGKTSHDGFSIYLQSILDREYQVRYATIDRIIDRLNQRIQRSDGPPHHFTPTQINSLRQRLYHMITIMQQQQQQPSNDRHQMRRNGTSLPNGRADTDTTTSATPQPPKTRWKVFWCETGSWTRFHATSISRIIHHDDLMFMRNLFLPAVLSLLVHCMIHTSLYDGTLAVLGIMKAHLWTAVQFFGLSVFHNDTLVAWFDPIWTTIVFTFGTILLRCTGDIYWWSSNSNYQLLKFDFHNRRQLLLLQSPMSSSHQQHWNEQNNLSKMVKTLERARRSASTCTMTQNTMWIRRRDIIRATLFMIGYTCCYIASHDYLQYATHFVQYCYNRGMKQQWNHHVLSNLPSIVEMTKNGICLSDDYNNIFSNESFCSAICQTEMEYRGMSRCTVLQITKHAPPNICDSKIFQPCLLFSSIV